MLNTLIYNEKKKLLYNKNFVNIVYALSILVFGFILLNLTFLIYTLYNGLIKGFYWIVY